MKQMHKLQLIETHKKVTLIRIEDSFSIIRQRQYQTSPNSNSN